MFSVVITPPVLYVKVTVALGSRALEQLCQELNDRHNELQGNYDSIFIDLNSSFELDFNFRPATRSFFHRVREQDKQLVLINPTVKTIQALRKQGLGSFLKIKHVSNKAPGFMEEFRGNSAVIVTGPDLRPLLESASEKIVKVMGLTRVSSSVEVSNEPPIHALVEMKSKSCELTIGLKVANRNVLSAAILKNFPNAAVDQSKLDQWACELLNMFVAQIASNPQNNRWGLVKREQPCPVSQYPKHQDLNFMLPISPGVADAAGIQLTYGIKILEQETVQLDEHNDLLKKVAR